MTGISRVLACAKNARKAIAGCLIAVILSTALAFLIGCGGSNSAGSGPFGLGNVPEVWVAAAKDEASGSWGLIDESGEWVLKPQFTDVTYSDLSGCVWAESLPTDTNTNGGWGLFDVVGNEWAIEPQFNEIRDFDANGLAAVQVPINHGDDWGFIDEWGFIDKTGAWVIDPQFEFVGRFASNGLAIAKPWTPTYEVEVGFIDTSGEWAIEPKYEPVYSSNHWLDGFAENGLALVEDPDTNMAIYIDETGAWVLGPFEYEGYYGRFASNGLAFAFDFGHFLDSGEALSGFIDATGEWVIEPQFAIVNDFSDGLACVTRIAEGRVESGFIDETGAWVVGPLDGYILGSQQGFDSNGLAVAMSFVPESQYAKYGYLNKAGEWAIEPQFEEAGGFSDNGLAPVMVRDYTKDAIAPGVYWGHWGFVDETGNWVIEPEFKVAMSFDLL